MFGSTAHLVSNFVDKAGFPAQARWQISRRQVMLVSPRKKHLLLKALCLGAFLSGEAIALQDEIGLSVQKDRIFRNAVPSTGANKTYPGLLGAPTTPYYFQANGYRNKSAAPVCVTFLFDPNVGDTPCGSNGHLSVYTAPYDPASQATNYLGDVGASERQPMSVTIPANTTAALVVTNTMTAAVCDFAITQVPNDVAVDFGAGLFQRLNNVGPWTRVNAASPLAIGRGNLNGNLQDELIATFAGAGTFARFDNAPWLKLNELVATRFTTGDLDANGRDELIADFGSAGLWARFNNINWVKLHNSTTQGLATGDLDGPGRDDLIADFGSAGLWVRYNNAAGWVRVNTASPTVFTTGDLDGNGRAEIIGSFSNGVRARFNNGGPAAWTLLHSSRAAQLLATGRLDGPPSASGWPGLDDLVIDFGAFGLWARYNNGTWKKVDTRSPTSLAITDLGNNGLEEIVASFGNGIFYYPNGGPWALLHPSPAQGLTGGAFD